LSRTVGFAFQLEEYRVFIRKADWLWLPLPKLVTLRSETDETPNYKGADSPLLTAVAYRLLVAANQSSGVAGHWKVNAGACHSAEKDWPQRKSFCILLGAV
jgi:hypothetical protein